MYLKKCYRCNKVKEISDFYKCKGREDGVQTCCKECKGEQTKKWHLLNHEKHSKMNKENYYKDRLNITKRHLAYNLHRRKSDGNFRILDNLRRRINCALHGVGSKSQRTVGLLGCTIPELKLHLESHFSPEMSWDNYGLHGWHIDHIIPCSAFDLSKAEEQCKCFNFSNLQPLWARDNLSKGGKSTEGR